MSGKKPQNIAMVADTKPSFHRTEIDMPILEAHQVLVKISHVAQNPTDVQSFDGKVFGDGAVLGCDFVGEVVRLGEKVSTVSKGDIVASFIWGGEVKGLGAYCHYTVADAKILFKLPSGLSPSAAATVPLAATTAWLAMFSSKCLDMEPGKTHSFLIWGGSSSVGQYAIQIGRLFGLDIITTCSPHNFDFVKKLGAKYAFDYKSPDVADQIRSVGDIAHVFDTIGNPHSAETSCKGANQDCTYCTVRPGKANTENIPKSVNITDVLVFTAFLKDHKYAEFDFPASEEDHELASQFYKKLPAWLESGEIRPNPVKPLSGLDSINDGFQLHRDGKLSAQKIVYEI